MPDIATISAFLGSIKTATDLAKAIRSADSSLEKAELKLKIAELMESLSDVKIQAVDIKELIQEKDAEIEKLNTLLNAKLFPQTDNLLKECIEIFKSFNKTSDEIEVWELAEHLQMSEQKTEYFLSKLVDIEFIDQSHYVGKSTYSLNQKGREYLFKNNLLE